LKNRYKIYKKTKDCSSCSCFYFLFPIYQWRISIYLISIYLLTFL